MIVWLENQKLEGRGRGSEENLQVREGHDTPDLARVGDGRLTALGQAEQPESIQE